MRIKFLEAETSFKIKRKIAILQRDKQLLQESRLNENSRSNFSSNCFKLFFKASKLQLVFRFLQQNKREYCIVLFYIFIFMNCQPIVLFRYLEVFFSTGKQEFTTQIFIILIAGNLTKL